METDVVNLNALTDSRLCLGTMLMGGKTPPADAHAMLDAFLEAGHNFIDTADVYGDGAAERTLKPWLAHRRDDVVITTKVRFGVTDPGGEGLAPERIRAACDASLRRLGIDTIDLYQIHGPDPTVPIEDVLETLDELVRAGKVRALGVLELPRLASRLDPAHPGRRRLGPLHRPPSAVLAGRALGRARAASALPLHRAPPDAVGPARRRLPDRTAHARRRAARPAAAWPTPPTAPKRRCTDARPSATSGWSRRPAPSPPSSTPPSRRSPSPGSYASPESAHRSSAPARCPSSTTSCPPRRSPSAMNTCAGSALTRRRPSSIPTACSPTRTAPIPSRT